MTWTKWFILLAILQGSFIAGFSCYMFMHYFPKSKSKIKFRNNDLEWHVISISFSYMLLTIASIITSALRLYAWADAWYFIVAFAYITGDFSLYKLFKHASYKTRMKTVNEKRISNLEKQIKELKKLTKDE